MGTSTFAGYAFGVLGPNLVDEFDISRCQLGLLTAVFFLVGGPLSLVAGPATDRFGARRVMLIAFAIAAADPRRHGAGARRTRPCWSPPALPAWRWRPAIR